MTNQRYSPIPFLILISLLVVSAAGEATEGGRPVRLKAFVDGHTIEKPIRFNVKNIEIGQASILNLFLPLETEKSRVGRYFGEREEITLKLKNQFAFSTLQSIALKHKKPRIIVLLEDKSIVAKIYNKFRRIMLTRTEFSNVLEIPIDLTPCERITQIFYDNIGPEFTEAVRQAGQTGESLKLEDVFDILLKNQVKPFMDSLDPLSKSDPCFRNFRLLEWLRNQEAHGFEFAEYKINPDLKEILSRVAGSLTEIRTWQLYDFQLYVTGYTDSKSFKEKPDLALEASATGIGGLKDPLKIYYSGCVNDRATGPPRPKELSEERGVPVGPSVNNNCELGAARAYVAAMFLRSRLGTKNMEYRYATGGISPTAPTVPGQKSDLLERKVDIRIVVKAAKEEKAQSFPPVQ
jgi:outer membrane protein OmpA-like peptidoglycan-associated protein